MALWDELELDGIALGTDLTFENTGGFFDGVPGIPATAGALIAAPVTGGGVGMRPRNNGFANPTKLLTGHTAEGRVGFKVEFLSSTATSAFFELLWLRDAVTEVSGPLGNVGLRNASGSRHMAGRNAFTYVGEATGNTMAANEQWSVEVYWLGTALTVYVWDSPDSSGAPLYTWTATMAAVPQAFFMGPSAVAGVSAITYDVWVTDGERRSDAPVPGTLVLASNTIATATSASIAVKTMDASTVQLKATPSLGGVVVSGPVVTPGVNDYTTISVTGLTPGTKYNWDVVVDGNSQRTGTIKTLKSPTGNQNILFGWGSCFDTASSGVFPLLTARDFDFFSMVGDWGYQYITGGLNGNTSPTDEATVRQHRETVLSSLVSSSFFTSTAVNYTYSDCDGAGANSDGTTGGHATGAVQAAYREQFAHPTLPVNGVGARSWVIGRIRFIQTDETAAASSKNDTDNSAKTKLGLAQKAWFKAQIDAAVLAGQSVIWIGDGPWINATVSTGTSNEWGRYNTERTEIGAYIVASGVKLVRVHGDSHSLFYDDGFANPWGGFPTASGAPLHTTAQAFGKTISGEKWPLATTNSSRQYGVGEIADNGTTITLTLKGYSSTNSAPTEVQRFTGVIDMTPEESTVVVPVGIPFLNGNGDTVYLSYLNGSGQRVVPATVSIN